MAGATIGGMSLPLALGMHTCYTLPATRGEPPANPAFATLRYHLMLARTNEVAYVNWPLESQFYPTNHQKSSLIWTYGRDSCRTSERLVIPWTQPGSYGTNFEISVQEPNLDATPEPTEPSAT